MKNKKKKIEKKNKGVAKPPTLATIGVAGYPHFGQ
jgi:hypothetical protein